MLPVLPQLHRVELPPSQPPVLTAFSAPPKNRTPVEGGSRGATGGGRRSSLLRRGLGLAASLPRYKEEPEPLSRTQQVVGLRYLIPKSQTHADTWRCAWTRTDGAQTRVAFPVHGPSNPFL